jgi:hypothetical protein
MSNEFFVVFKQEPQGAQNSRKGHAQFGPNERLYGDLQEPQIPVDFTVTQDGALYLRPSYGATAFEVVKLSANEEQPINDTREPIQLESGPTYTRVDISSNQALEIRGNIDNNDWIIRVYP